ncbi:MAG: biotin/lipoyl-containing protein [Pyrinomonadaceae bacterium]
MSVEVIMPQMGESITEGTVSRWLKNVGDKIEKDEPILEISTDKVDAEVPSPAAGVLLAINVPEGETVEVGTALAVVGQAGEDAASTPSASPEPAKVPEPAPVVEKAAAEPVAPPPSVSAPSSGGSSVEVVMPQMGESITEGTVSKWLKAVGDTVEKDEALLEISTDKVDAEVPSPVAGKVLGINVQEGETVEVGSVLAMVGSSSGAPASAPEPAPKAEEKAPAAPAAPAAVPVAPPKPVAPVAAAATAGGGSVDELRRAKSSPLVRNIAKEHGIDITYSWKRYQRPRNKERHSELPRNRCSTAPGRSVKEHRHFRQDRRFRLQNIGSANGADVYAGRQADLDGRSIEKMSVMRKKIAEHMTFSKQ